MFSGGHLRTRHHPGYTIVSIHCSFLGLQRERKTEKLREQEGWNDDKIFHLALKGRCFKLQTK